MKWALLAVAVFVCAFALFAASYSRILVTVWVRRRLEVVA